MLVFGGVPTMYGFQNSNVWCVFTYIYHENQLNKVVSNILRISPRSLWEDEPILTRIF